VKRHKQLKYVNNFYDSFSASDFKPSETGKKKEKKTNINRYLYLYLQTTIKQKNTTTSGTLDFCAFPAVVTRIQPSQVTQPGWLSFAFGLPFMAFVF